MDLGEVYKQIGEFGPYQLMVCTFLVLTSFSTTFASLGIVFTMAVSDHYCYIPDLKGLNSSQQDILNATIPYDDETGEPSQCDMYDRDYSSWTEDDVTYYVNNGNVDNASTVACKNDWVYDLGIYGDTATTDFNLVCSDRWWQAAASSIFSLGLLVGTFINGTLADRFGRKPLLLVCYVILVLLHFVCALSPGYPFLMTWRFVMGYVTSSFYGISPTLISELVGPTWRGHMSAFPSYIWAVAGVLLAGLAAGIDDWRVLTTVFGLLSLPALGIFWVPESPRWLCTVNKEEKAKAIFQRIAESNKKEFTAGSLSLTGENEKTGAVAVYPWSLCSSRSSSIRTVVLYMNCFTVSLTYYGLTLSSTSFGGNVYGAFALSMLVEVPGVFIYNILAIKGSRRWSLTISMGVSGVALLITLAFEPESAGMIVFVTLGKLACTVAFNLVYIYAIELYPTIVRSIAASSCTTLTSLGAVAAPFLAQLSDFGVYIPNIIMGLCSLATGLLAILLPETLGTYLEDTFTETKSSQENKIGVESVESDVNTQQSFDNEGYIGSSTTVAEDTKL